MVTGDKKIDALLWLRQVIETGDPGRIEQAKEAACRMAYRFKALPELMPHTLSDCRHKVAYWDDLYRLHRACDTSGNYENRMKSSARDWFIFGLLAELRPRTREEAKDTLRYLMDSDRQGMPEAEQILENFVS